MRPRVSAPLAPLAEDLDALAEAVRRLLQVRTAAGISPRDLDSLLDVLRAIEGAVAALKPELDRSGAPDEAQRS